MTDEEAVLWGQFFAWAGRLAVAHPRPVGVLAVLFGLFAAWGFIGANAPTDILRAKGWKRSADFFDAGATWGAFAWDVVSKIRKRLARKEQT